jgi:hypothetical protein
VPYLPIVHIIHLWVHIECQRQSSVIEAHDHPIRAQGYVQARSSRSLDKTLLPDSEIALVPRYPESEGCECRCMVCGVVWCGVVCPHPYLQRDVSVVHGEVFRRKIGADRRLVALFELSFAVPASKLQRG